ncbi:Nucleic acid binding, putative isoform 1 [Hibiscus syriacus]|uniref:Nucleic acid binding, putative isoform 1 n=1 Tax=Hibiscus syriacus TaxID=106335 RepID=A0A6A3CRY8_HIBSY|nr:Nucleic acid binding, putative isoform 1 [Hibiscus syriacus]
MSRMNTHGNRQDGDIRNNFQKSQKKFIPKNQKQNPNPTSLSNSIRQSLPKQHDAPASSTTAAVPGGSTSSRVRMGESGDWVPNTATPSSLSNGNFVNYLPQDEAVAAGLSAGTEDWTQWNRRESRWYDFPHRGVKGIVAGVIIGEFELNRRVFMLLYRISSNRDPGARAADSLSANDHAVILQENKLLDVPNSAYNHDNLTGVLFHFLSIVYTMHERCSTSLEVLLSSGNHGDDGFDHLHADFLEVMDFINDAIVAMDAFVTAYRPAAIFFSCPVEMSHGNEELLTTLSHICYLSDEVFLDAHPIPTATKMFPGTENEKHDTFLKNLEKNCNLMRKLENLQNTGWLFMEDEQFQYLSGITMYLTKGIAKEQTPKPPIPASGQAKICMLEVYNQNPEEVIQRILEGTLHGDFQALDTSLETMPEPKSASTLSRNDKGKGKMVDTDKVGRFIRKSKDDSPDSATLDAGDENDSLRKWGIRKKPQYYVKDGKNYSYKVAGSVAVANANEASLVTQAQGEMIHGLGRGGNLPLGAVKKLMDREEQTSQPDISETGGREHTRNSREEEDKESLVVSKITHPTTPNPKRGMVEIRGAGEEGVVGDIIITGRIEP